MDDDEVPQLLDTSSSPPPELEARDQADDQADSGPSNSKSTYDRSKIPITLLTGYLGAGKSTLLNYVLTAQHGYKIAVCMNDFGDTTDIEAKAITLSDPSSSSTSSSFLSLPNGCLCCSVKDMGIAAIEEMVASAPGGIDWVLVELTGVADPGPIIRSFWRNEEMGDLILDGVVCVVDSRNVLKQLAETRPEGEINEAQKQVACADVILLNKLDLVSEEQLKQVESVIRTINPTLRVHYTTHSRMPLEGMFNLGAFSDPTALTESTSSSRASQQHEHTHESGHKDEGCDDPSHSHSHTHGNGNGHLNGISTVLIPLPPLTNAQYIRLNTFLESVIWDERYPAQSNSNSVSLVNANTNPGPGARLANNAVPEILRTKGYIPLEDGREYVLQGVADLFELKEIPLSSSTSTSTSTSKTTSIPPSKSASTPLSAEAANRKRENAEEVQKSVTGGKVVFIGRGVGEEMKLALLKYVGLVV